MLNGYSREIIEIANGPGVLKEIAPLRGHQAGRIPLENGRSWPIVIVPPLIFHHTRGMQGAHLHMLRVYGTPQSFGREQWLRQIQRMSLNDGRRNASRGQTIADGLRPSLLTRTIATIY